MRALIIAWALLLSRKKYPLRYLIYKYFHLRRYTGFMLLTQLFILRVQIDITLVRILALA